MKKTKPVLFLALAVFTGTVSAQKILYSSEKQMGIRAPDVSLNRWNSQIMDISEPYGEREYTSLNADFFTKEYGTPLVFHDNLLKRFGARVEGDYAVKNGALEFNTPAKGWSVLFGARRGENKIPAIRFGRGWGKLSECRYRLELDMEQNVPETQWSFFRHSPYGKQGKKFKISGNERRLRKIDLGMIGNNPYMIGGIEFQCTTPGARLRIHSMRIVPYMLNISWRRKFRLDFEPLRGGISLYPRCTYDLFVNGQPVSSGTNLLSGGHGVIRLDISNQLRKGENEILYRGNFNGGHGPSSRLSQESFVIGENGETVRLPGDLNWEWSFDGKNWHKPVLRGRIGEERQPNGNMISEGSLPLHAGPMQIRQLGEPYPVFDCDGEISYAVSIPAGIALPELTLTIRHPLSGNVMEQLEFKRNKLNGRLREFTVKPKLRETGAYNLEWELRSAGKVIDRTRTEMMICGPLKLDEFAFKDFETELEKRLMLIQRIDCTKEYGPRNFLDHSSKFSSPKLNMGRIITQNGMKYRETGDSSNDYFAYKLNLRNRGAAHIAEIIIPDNAERILYSTINETFPVNFCNNNFPVGSRGWPNASGSVMTGGLYPLSFKKKTMRYVFFPASDNITIMLENGKTGSRAAVCAINIYEVRGGLPALKLPDTGRFYANHNERFLFHNWGAFVSPRIQEATQDGFESSWTAAFYGLANRISYLKFAGHNASVEGSYMYSQGFPTRSGHSMSTWTEFDYYYAMLKMYKHNGIRAFVGFEYMRSPKLNLENRYDIGDREVQAGTARSIHNVDRHGKQSIGYQGMGLNYLNPHVWNSITELLGEIYQRYEKIGGIEGLFIINGHWWLPGFTTPPGQTAEEIGYDDDSVEQFESDTGLRLNLPSKGRERFEKRYTLLNGRYYKEWYAWRSRKMRNKLEELAKIISSGKNSWKLFAVPNVNYPENHPFNRMNAKVKERDTFQETYLKRAAFDPALYGKKDGITLVPKVDFDHQLTMPRYGSITNRGTRKLYEKNDAVYLAPVGLNERGCTAKAAKEWWWRSNGVCVYDLKPAGEFAFADLTDVISGHTPKYMFHTWLDVNCTTAHTAEARRLLSGFYATPELPFVPFPGICGIQAKSAGDYIQLVNDTPYPVSGFLTAGTKAKDKVTGKTFTGKIRYEVRPFGIAVIQIPDPVGNLNGSFSFDKETSGLIHSQANAILTSPQLRNRIHPEYLATIQNALKEKNDYKLCTAMRDFEVLHAAKRFFDSAPYQLNQNRLLQLLEKGKTVRINCGSSIDYTDENGYLWLPDQPYTGFNAYGNEFATSVYRGTIPINNTKAPEVYRNEAYGNRIYYHIPLPPGEYRVKLHFAETWDKYPGRKMDVTVAGQKKIVRPWETAGGRCSAATVTWDSVIPRDGLLSIEIAKNPIINGIEIKRTKEKKTAPPAAVQQTSAGQSAETLIDAKPAKGMKINWNRQIFGKNIIAGNRTETKQEGKNCFFSIGPDSNFTVSSAKPKTPRNKERTITMLIRTNGKKGFLQLNENIYRYDVIVNEGKVKADITFFPPGKQWFSVRYPSKEFFENGKWHHIAITVNPQDNGMIFVDGELKVQKPLKQLHSLEIPPGRAGITAAIWGKKAHSEDFRVDIARIVYRDELMSTPEIKKEADEWLASAE